MRRSLPLLLLAVSACAPAPPAVVLGGEGCDAIELAVLDPAVLPGWTVHSLVAERDDGDAVWTLATAPEGALFLKPWPDGPALDLTGLGDADDFSLLPGRTDGESWLLLDRQDQLRVWRLGSAATGEVTASPDLTSFPGPGGWSYSLLLVGEVPYLVAAATGVPVKSMRFQFAPLDPRNLSLGPSGPVHKFADLCMPPAELPCSIFTANPLLADVDALATTEPGTMGGAAVLFGVAFDATTAVDPGFIMLQLSDRGPDRPPDVVARMLAITPAPPAPRLQGRIASDGQLLFMSVAALAADDPEPPVWFGLVHVPLGDDSSGLTLGRSPTRNGPVLQFGREVVLTGLEHGRWGFDLLQRDSSLTADLALPNDTQVWSAGHAQWFALPPTGLAMRLGARCAADEQPGD